MFPTNRFLIVSLCVLPLCSVGVAQTQAKPDVVPWRPPQETQPTDEADGLTLLARYDKASYKPVEPITLTAVFRNNGMTNASYYSESLYGMFGFHVIMPDGKGAPLTEYGKRAMLGPQVSRSTLWLVLKPGEEQTYTFVVNRFYDMSMDGKYKISVLGDVMTRGDIVKWDKNMTEEEILKTVKRSRFLSKTTTINVDPH